MWKLIENGNRFPNEMSVDDIKKQMANNPDSNFQVWKQGMEAWVDPQTLDVFTFENTAAQNQIADTAAQTPIVNSEFETSNDENEIYSDDQDIDQLKQDVASFDFLPHLKGIDWILNRIGKTVTTERLDFFDDLAKKWGLVAMFGSIVSIVIWGITLLMKNREWSDLLQSTFITCLSIIILQYVAFKFLDAGKILIKKSPTYLSSRSFLDSIGLLLLLLIPVSFIGGVILAIDTESLLPFAMGLGLVLYFAYILAVTVRPQAVNVVVKGDASAGQEAIAMFSLFLKLSLRIVPLAFGVINIIAPFAIIFLSASVITTDYPFSIISQYELVKNTVFAAALYPMLSYLVFLISYLFVDVIQAILEIPKKINNLKP